MNSHYNLILFYLNPLSFFTSTHSLHKQLFTKKKCSTWNISIGTHYIIVRTKLFYVEQIEQKKEAHYM